MFTLDYLTGKIHLFDLEIPEPFDPSGLEGQITELRESIGKLPNVEFTTAQFHTETIDDACYVKITDGGVVAINADVLSRMPVEKIVVVRHSGPLAITGAFSPESAYDAISDGYREFSIYKTETGETTITVYEKPLTSV